MTSVRAPVRRNRHAAATGPSLSRLRERAGVRAVFLALALACAAPAVHAGLFDDEEARKQIAATSARLDKVQKDLEARLAALEQQAKNQSLDLLRDLEAIKADVARIRGQIEVLTHELSEAQKRQRDLYVDLDTRMRKLEGGPGPAAGTPATDPAAAPAGANAAAAPTVPAAGAPPPATPATTPATNEQRAYDAALEAFKRGDYGGAIGGFQSFVKTYPKSALAPSAQYWVGNAQFARREYRPAIASQRQLIQLWPDSAKVPDALLNIASAQAELGESAAARRTLEELVGKYPQSESAAKAKQRLGAR